MSIMDKLFGSGARHNGQNNQPQNLPTPGNVPPNTGMAAPGNNGVAPNGVTPSIPPNSQQTTEAPKSPFAEFEKLWEPATGPDGKPLQVTKEPLYNVDPKQVMEAAQRTDFRSVASKEQLEKMAAGGADGIAAMMDVMQAMSASVYANAAVAATKIAEQGISKAMSQAESRLPGVIRNQQLSESLVKNNPALQDPAVRPLVDLVRNQFAQKFPNATSAELESMANDYMLKAGSAFNPTAQKQQQQEEQRQQAAGSEWDKFFAEDKNLF